MHRAKICKKYCSSCDRDHFMKIFRFSTTTRQQELYKDTVLSVGSSASLFTYWFAKVILTGNRVSTSL